VRESAIRRSSAIAALTEIDFVFDQTPVTQNAGSMVISDGAMLPLSGMIENIGTIELNSTGTETDLQLVALEFAEQGPWGASRGRFWERLGSLRWCSSYQHGIMLWYRRAAAEFISASVALWNNRVGRLWPLGNPRLCGGRSSRPSPARAVFLPRSARSGFKTSSRNRGPDRLLQRRPPPLTHDRLAVPANRLSALAKIASPNARI